MSKRKFFRQKEKEVTPEELLSFVQSLMELNAIDFIGVMKIMCVKWEEDKKPRALDVVLSEVIDRYLTLAQSQRKEINQIIHAAASQKGDSDLILTQINQTQSKTEKED